MMMVMMMMPMMLLSRMEASLFMTMQCPDDVIDNKMIIKIIINMEK